MISKIERDTRRFKEIARGQVRKNLRTYISRGELIGRRGKNLVSIPIPQVEIPRFRFGPAADRGRGGRATARRARLSDMTRTQTGRARLAISPVITSWRWS